jgi:hypothetical protein
MRALLLARGVTVGENGPVILLKWRLFTPFRDLLHAANLRHGANGFTSLPNEGMLRIMRHSTRKKHFPNLGLLKSWFQSYDVLEITENAPSVQLYHEYSMSHIWTETVGLAGNFHMPYGSTPIHLVFVFASPERLWLLEHKQQSADISRDKNIQGFKSGEAAGRTVGPLPSNHCFRNSLIKYSGTARRKCVDHQHVYTIYEPQSAVPHLATAINGGT